MKAGVPLTSNSQISEEEPATDEGLSRVSSRGWGLLRGFLELWRLWGFSHEARRGSQGASRVVPGKSGLHGRGKGERVIALQSG